MSRYAGVEKELSWAFGRHVLLDEVDFGPIAVDFKKCKMISP
jgi:hypothetical protein